MLMTHLRPSELWGKKVYEPQGRLLGEVVLIASRRGVVRKVVVQRVQNRQTVRLLPPAHAQVDSVTQLAPSSPMHIRPRLRIVH